MATAKTLQLRNHPRHDPLASGSTGPRPNELVMLSLNDLGLIRDCSATCAQMFGYLPAELAGCHVSTLLPQLPPTELVQDGRISPRLAYLCHCGFAFEARHRDGQRFAIELFINRLDDHNVVVLVRGLDASPAMNLPARVH